MLIANGVPTPDDLATITPPAARLMQRACAVVECFQKIPCNPCATSCPSGAFVRDNDINELPVLDWEKCTGCGICVALCPGLAIFIVDCSGEMATVRLPYELLPLPTAGQEVQGLGRDGAVLCDAKVLRVQNAASQDRTAIVWLEVPREFAMAVRHFKEV